MRRVFRKKWVALSAPIGLVAALILLLAFAEGAFSGDGSLWGVLEGAIITLMGEYPDPATTSSGRLVQLLLLASGTLVLGTIVGKISSLFVTHALQRDVSMKKFSDHIIICNWNNKAPSVIRQLAVSAGDESRDIVVVSSSEIREKNDFEDCETVHFVREDPSHHAVLSSLNATRAKSVILLADPESSGPDEKNALIALAVKHLEQSPERDLDIHVVAELIQPDRRRHLHEAGVDEVVMFQDYSSGILAQSALFHNMSVVYQRLLTYSDDTNEIYFIEPGAYPASYAGKSFPELCKAVKESESASEDNPLLLLGVKLRNGDILLNPQKQRFAALSEGDTLIVMAFRPIARIADAKR